MNLPFLLSPKINIVYLESGMTVRQGIEKFKVHGYSAVPVLDSEGHYVGTVSEGDFLRFILSCGDVDLRKMEKASICEIIRKNFNPPVSIDASLDEILAHLLDTNFAPVVDGRECFVGIVTRKSVIEYLRKASDTIEWRR